MSCPCPTDTAPRIDTTGLTIQQRRELAMARLGRKPRPMSAVRAIRNEERHARGPGRMRYEPLEQMPFTGQITRHLCYHVWPVRGNGTWQANLRQLLQRIDLFNGRRRIGIVTDDKTDPAGAVMEFLDGYDCEFVVDKNVSRLREVVTFLPLLSPLESTDPNEVIFYAQAKGVRHKPFGDETTTVHRWASAQYETCLDDWESVEAALIDNVFAGSFKRYGEFRTPGNNRWHYSGSFYWSRSARIFDRNWSKIDRMFFGAESWPGRMAHPQEAACLFHDHCGDLYLPNYWTATVQPELEAWKLNRSVTV
jgi:hypothetical protein